MQRKVWAENAAVLCQANWQDVCEYDVGNKRTMAQFDGRGRIVKASAANWSSALEQSSHYCSFEIDGKPLPESADKTVWMLGREQRISCQAQDVQLESTLFLNEAQSAVFAQYSWRNASADEHSVRMNFGFVPDCSDKTVRTWNTRQSAHGVEGIEIDYAEGGLYVAFSQPVQLIELLENKLYFTIAMEVAAAGSTQFRMVMTFGAVTDASECAALLDDFDEQHANSQKYAEWLEGLSDSCDAMERALVASCINCAVSSYKELPEVNFRGFFAGINYQKPARTYYRDGFWTVMPLLTLKPEWVRNEIVTLAHGVACDGECPSAVIAANDYAAWWPKHWDSPAFFAIMLDEYIESSGDMAILQQIVHDTAGRRRSILRTMQSCVEWLKKQTDKSHLIVKPRANRLDWADNVYREGYVTYINALYYRALLCADKYIADCGYGEQALAVKQAINDVLWSESKGWYVNYQSAQCTEDHLSLDSLVCLLYDVADQGRAQQVLDNCERWLQSRNNTTQEYGDWGAMCVYPFYKHKQHLVEKSCDEYRYHNGSDWPYLSGLYAVVAKKYRRSWQYPAKRWFEYGLAKGWFTPVEYYDPVHGHGSYLQAWSAMPALAFLQAKND